MGQITLRRIDPQIEREIRRKAKESGRSLNSVAQEFLAEGAGLGKGRKARRGASLAVLAGGWTEKDAREFKEAIKIFEELEGEMWK